MPAASDAIAKAITENYVIIEGVAVGLDEIVDQEFFAAKRVEALREAFFKAPVPHIVIDGLFSSRLLELVYADLIA
jgi:hypothetical protein